MSDAEAQMIAQAAQVLGLPAQLGLNNFLSQAQVAWTRLFISRAG